MLGRVAAENLGDTIFRHAERWIEVSALFLLRVPACRDTVTLTLLAISLSWIYVARKRTRIPRPLYSTNIRVLG